MGCQRAIQINGDIGIIFRQINGDIGISYIGILHLNIGDLGGFGDLVKVGQAPQDAIIVLPDEVLEASVM